MGFELNLICCVKGKPLCAESVGGGSAKRKYKRDYRVQNRIGCTDFVGDCFLLQKPKLCSNNRKVMEKKPENIKQSSKSAKPPSEERKTQSKPKTGKIVRVVPMGIPFSPEQFKRIQELSQRDLSD